MTSSAPTPRDAGVADLVGLAAGYVDELVLASVRDTHRAVADRVWGSAGALTAGAATPGRRIHDLTSAGIYAGLGLGLRGVRRAVEAGRASGPRLGPAAAPYLSALNGLVGDRLERENSPLAMRMEIRQAGDVVAPTAEGLADAFGPHASGRVVVLLHGLGETERDFSRFSDRVGATYASVLADLGWTPVLVRYNTGLSLRENGAALASLLGDLVAAWPTPVERLALIGHSMGGLVARAAGAVEVAEDDRRWRPLLTDVVTLGTPHLGADLARGVGLGSRGLARLPESAAFGRILDHRSAGIVDLTDGLPDLPALPGVRYRLVAATLGRHRRHPLGLLFGDLLVREASATGRDRHGRSWFPDADVVHVTASHHFHLLNHAEVHARLPHWLAPAR